MVLLAFFIYNSLLDDAAMKSAKNELRGLESHKTTHTSGLFLFIYLLMIRT